MQHNPGIALDQEISNDQIKYVVSKFLKKVFRSIIGIRRNGFGRSGSRCAYSGFWQNIP